MYVIEKMRLNKIEVKPVISNRQTFLMNGAKPATVDSKDTSDCKDDVMPVGARKTQLLGLAQSMAQKAYEMRETAGDADALTPKNPREM